MIASASERSNEGLTSTGKGSRRGSLQRAAHPPFGRWPGAGSNFELSSRYLPRASTPVPCMSQIPRLCRHQPPPRMHCCASLTIGLVVAGAGIVEAHTRPEAIDLVLEHVRRLRLLLRQQSLVAWLACGGCSAGKVCLPTWRRLLGGSGGGAWARPKQGKAAAMIRTPANRVAALEVRRRGHQSDGKALVETRSAL